MAYSDEVLADSPVAYFRLEETSGTTVTDSSGNGRTATYVNSPTLNQTSTGTLSKCVSLDGTNDYINIADHNVLSMNNTNAFTFEAWINMGVDSNKYLVSKLDNTNQYEYELEWRTGIGGGSGFAWSTKHSAGEIYGRIGNGGKTTNTWYHVVVTCNGAPGSTIPKMYVNGVEETSNGTSGSGGTYANGTSPLYVGGRVFTASYTQFKVDEIAIYNTALSATRIQAHYDAGRGFPTVNAPVTNITLDAKDGEEGLGIEASNTNIAVGGQAATVIAESNITVSAPVTNVAVNGQVLTGFGGTINVNATTANIIVSAPAPTVEFGVAIEATKANLTLVSNNTFVNDYATAVLQKSPIRYWRFNESSGYLVDQVAGQVLDSTNVIHSQDGITNVTDNDSIWVAGPKTWTPPPIIPNHTYEYWIKTTDSSMYLLWGQTIIGTTQPYRGYVLVGGYLAFRAGSAYSNPPDEVSGAFVADGLWHHIVMTKATVGSTLIYNTYIDGYNVAITSFDPSGGGYVQNMVVKGQTFLDEFAIYNRTLTLDEIRDHYIKGVFILQDAQIEATTSNVTVSGKATALSTSINTTTANISARSIMPDIKLPGQVFVGVDYTGVRMSGNDVTSNVERSVTILTIAADIELPFTDSLIRTMEDMFKFIPSDDSSLTAIDADELLSINLGALLFNQFKNQSFKMGNTGNRPIRLILRVQSTNEDFVDMVTLSTDKDTYSSTIVIDSLAPNSISDPIWFRVNAGAVRPGHGTFLVTVEQSNA